ncbi:MAG: thioredoxin-disulfide reductase [Clostridia bacterium]|nr:thioredoxin-disulfide reductase [Clostridia bacterium]
MYDIIIIGAGPAGLSAAIYAGRAGLNCLILESTMYGGQITSTPEVENYPSVKKIAGWELADNLYQQAVSFGAQLNFESVESIVNDGALKTVITKENAYVCKTVIIANGAKRKHLGIEGEDEFSGKGVSYCAYCDGSFFKDKTVCVCGGGNTALEDALYLSNVCKKVYLIHRRNEYRAQKHLVDLIEKAENIEPVLSYLPVRISGDNTVKSITLKQKESEEEITLETDAVFVCIGLFPENASFSDVVSLDDNGYIIADETCKTSCEGIFAAGDTRTKELRQIVTAASDGAIAATAALSYINQMED